MADYGHGLEFGVFITPLAQASPSPVELAVVADRAGLDLATFQDHPYQAAFFDTWTLLAFIAARTQQIRLAPNVVNLPLRPPAVLARSVASLDRLSGGRVELGLGAGSFWDAIVAMGGRRLTPGQSIAALEEAIAIMRDLWDAGKRGGVFFEGQHYQVRGAKRGPAPAHPVPLWVGAYGRRMLRLTGRLADAWVPSLGYLRGGPADLTAMNAEIDAGAASAGRDPSAVRRLLNIGGRFAADDRGFLDGPPERWARDLAVLALRYGVSGFLLAADDAETIERFASDVAPLTRARVASARADA